MIAERLPNGARSGDAGQAGVRQPCSRSGDAAETLEHRVRAWLRCRLGHDWDGCRCARCGKLRDALHHWNGCKCKHCGATRDEQHDWDGRECKRCGRIDELYGMDEYCRRGEHAWELWTCGICGASRK